MELTKKWKFKKDYDDNKPEYAKFDYDDKDWDIIDVSKTWEEQGHKSHAGFVWYRLHVVIPSSFRDEAEIKDSLIINLGQIDDWDEIYFNGEMIGENNQNTDPDKQVKKLFREMENSLWNKKRYFALPADSKLIKWDQENVIAVKDYGLGVKRKLFYGDFSIKMSQLSDYLKLEMNRGIFESKDNKYVKKIIVENISTDHEINCNLVIEQKDNITEENIYQFDKAIKLSPKSKQEIVFEFDKLQQSSRLDYYFSFENVDDVQVSEMVPYVLTPKQKDTPQINGASIYGQRPNNPFLYRIPVTGKTPISFDVENLPEGLRLDSKTGILSGKVAKEGTYNVTITATNELGTDKKDFEIVIGQRLALTPSMGWNSWNCWGLAVDQQKVLDTAKSFIDLGLANHGWTYVNIDDGWEIFGKSEDPKRSPDGEFLTNEKFPDMKKLAQDIHSLGLKLGIYSSPGEFTCGGYTGSLNHEYQDAKTFADWGIDYLKYDLCTYREKMKDPKDDKELIPPYKLMGDALKKVNRDIIYSLCEYGNGDVWEWGDSVGGQLWRTTEDIWDNWERMYQIGFGQTQAAKYCKPGNWNDPDMLVLGWVGWGPNLHLTSLTPDEQYTHVSMWVLISAPLLLGNDLTRLDEFTLSLITNDEVIAIDQDKLGNQATPVIKEDGIEVWKKNLYDGNIAFGIFNISEQPKEYTLDLSKLELKDEVTLRNVWTQKNIGDFKNVYKTVIPAHGVNLLRTV